MSVSAARRHPGSSLFFRQPRPEDFRSSSGSLTKLAPILLASPRVRSFAQALLKRVLLKRVLGPALLKRVSWAVSGFAQCIGCAAQPHRATAVAITIRNDRMALPFQCADGAETSK
jgi:hypothetical protein